MSRKLISILLMVVVSAVFLIVSTLQKSKDPLLTQEDQRSEKCIAWSTYDTEVNAWRWRRSDFNEYFPTRDESVTNCIASLNSVLPINN